jgi:hypothetical protein
MPSLIFWKFNGSVAGCVERRGAEERSPTKVPHWPLCLSPFVIESDGRCETLAGDHGIQPFRWSESLAKRPNSAGTEPSTRTGAATPIGRTRAALCRSFTSDDAVATKGFPYLPSRTSEPGELVINGACMYTCRLSIERKGQEITNTISSKIHSIHHRSNHPSSFPAVPWPEVELEQVPKPVAACLQSDRPTIRRNRRPDHYGV